MAAKDKYHDTVRNALLKDGWVIRHEPLVIGLGTDLVYVDMSADAPLSAEKDGEKIAVEVKSFLRSSDIHEFGHALGQFLFYRSLLKRLDRERIMYLAIPESAYQDVFQKQIVQPAMMDYDVKLIVVNSAAEKIVLWKR